MRILREFLSSTAGNMAIIFGLSLVPVAGLAGVALDYSRASQARTELQAAVDAAAFGAILFRGGQTEEARTAEAQRILSSNFAADVSAEISAHPYGRTASVAASAQIPTAILPILGISAVEVAAQSTAVKIQEGPPVCILALNRTASGAVTFSGGSSFEGRSCAVHSNSGHGNGLVVDGTASVTAAGLCSVGGAKAPLSVRPQPETRCDVLDDPFSELPTPSTSGCAYNNFKVQPHQSKVLQPGVYCGGLDIKGEASFQPGVYVIKDGPLNINSQAKVSGDGVTFYLTGAGSGFSISASGLVDLRAPKEGTYGGILMFQDRTSNLGSTNTLNGGSDTRMEGAIYTAGQSLTVNGSSGFLQSIPFVSIVADQVKISGSAGAGADTSGIDLAAPLARSYSGARLTQ